MNSDELLNTPKVKANAKDMLKDLLQGDPQALAKFDNLNLDKDAIKTALSFILNSNLSEEDKASLLGESWRINFRAKPPTPEEFLTEKYLGSVAQTIRPYIKDTFIKFLDPDSEYRHLILYPSISWGKALSYDEEVQSPSGSVPIGNLKIGDEVCTPNGGTAKVINIADFPNETTYKVTLRDGRSIKVCGNHNWKAFRQYIGDDLNKQVDISDSSNIPWEVVTTDEIIENRSKHPSQIWRVPIPSSPVYYNIVHKHDIAPYTLGVILSNVTSLIEGNNITFLTSHKEVCERVSHLQGKCNIIHLDNDEVPSKYKYKVVLYDLAEHLKSLGIHGLWIHANPIPSEYLVDSIDNRLELLRGILHCNSNCIVTDKGDIELFCGDTLIVSSILTLIRGLGGVVYNEGLYFNNENYLNAYLKIRISFPYNNLDILLEDNKKDKLKGKEEDKYLEITDIKELPNKGGRCIEIDDKDRLFISKDYVVTHNSFLSTLINLYISVCVSLMRDPYKYFGLSPATLLCILLISYSLKKSRELLLKPFENMMGASPFFEKVPRKETMKELKQEFASKNYVDKLYYTTADPDSDFTFDSGLTIKTNSTVAGLLGLSIISATLSELAFFIDAGKALSLDTLVRTDKGDVPIGDINIGDKVLSPNGEYSTVVAIPWEGEDDLYEITVDDGRTVQCNLEHLWLVSYRDIGGEIHKVVASTRFLLEHPDVEFDIEEYSLEK